MINTVNDNDTVYDNDTVNDHDTVNVMIQLMIHTIFNSSIASSDDIYGIINNNDYNDNYNIFYYYNN